MGFNYHISNLRMHRETGAAVYDTIEELRYARAYILREHRDLKCRCEPHQKMAAGEISNDFAKLLTNLCSLDYLG